MAEAGKHRPELGVARPRRALSVRVRLMILAVVAVTPLLLERFHNEEMDRGERIQSAYKQALDVARQGAAEQNQVIASARAVLQVVATTRSMFNFSEDTCNQFVATIVKPAPWFRTVSVANLQGQIVCSSALDAIGLDVSKRPHFQKAVDNSEPVLGDYFRGTLDNAPRITLALAQREVDGAATAILLGVLDLNWFQHVAEAFVPLSGCILMIDGQGTVLAQYPSRQNMVGRNFKDHPLVQNMMSTSEGYFTSTALDGVRRIFGVVKLPGTEARIAVGLDEKEILGRVDREMWTAFAEAGIVAVLVLLGIWFGGERILIRPIRALADTAGRIGRGEGDSHATELPWAAEFVPLAVALDDMAAKLRLREFELRDSNKQLRELSQIDALTCLANRRSFNERLAAEWEFSGKLRQPVAILMIDVDFFKNFNDHYGHVQGDLCLRKVSDVLMEGTRKREEAAAPALETQLPPSFHRIAARARRPDFAARYGGEEFAVLLQGADLDGALVVAERLRQGVEEMLIAHAGAPWGFISISIGAASMLPTDQSSPQKLTEAADAALYEAKRNGRNCVHGFMPVALSQAV